MGDCFSMKTAVVNTNTINRKWYITDSSDMVLGRFATKIANILMGKGKPAYSPNQDHGDFVVVVNADKIRLTGNKADQKEYFRHSGYAGGEKFRSFKEQMELDSAKVVYDAIKGMVPKTVLGRQIITKLHVYSGSEHPHGAQKPETLTV